MPESHNQLDWLFTVKQVAQACGVSERTVRRWTASGDLPYHKINRSIRVSREDFHTFVGEKKGK